jgi:putative NADH-flavin reductase
MKIALIGPTGMIGQRILQEALARNHEVRAIVRDPARISDDKPKLHVKTGDVLNPESVAPAVAGSDIVISAFGPGTGDPNQLVAVAHSLVKALQRSRPTRLIVVGGAGSLEVAPGLQLVDTPDFPPAWKPVALAHRDALNVYRAADLDWTYVSPSALIQPGERMGRYRTGIEQLLIDEKGESRISAEDFAVAILDEVEHPRFVRKRFTVGY